MSGVSSYRELLIWQKGMDITEKVFQLSKNFPVDELYGLTSQIKRCSISIPSNIAEGFGRNSTKSYIHFVKIARGSLFELETQLLLANKLNFIKSDDDYLTIMNLITEESKMISSFIKKLSVKSVELNN
jgi:four helix bundle protein